MSSPQIDRLRRRLMAIPQQVKADVAKALDASANEMVAAAQSLAPVEDGDLRRSIRIEPGDHALHRVVEAGGPLTTRPVRKGSGATYDYALAQEFGTAEQPEQPFFFPAYRLVKKRLLGRINRAINKAAKDAAKGPS